MSAPFFPFGLYDKDETPPGSAQWQARYRSLLTLMAANGCNTVLLQEPRTASGDPTNDPTDELWLLNEADAHGLRTIKTAGNPQNAAWDQAGPGKPFHVCYTHRSVIAYKYGDEPKFGVSQNLNVTGATSTNPVVLTVSANHNWGSLTRRITIAGMPGDFAAANGSRLSVKAGNNTISLLNDNGTGFNGSAFAAYTSGGTMVYTSNVDALVSPYSTLEQHYPSKPTFTVTIGDRATLDNSLGPPPNGLDDPESGVERYLWDTLSSSIRIARYYPMRRDYALLPQEPNKYIIEYHIWCQQMEAELPSPWWLVLQCGGRGIEKIPAPSVTSFWRVPTSAELSALAHLALAYGCRGLLGFSMGTFLDAQPPSTNDWIGLVDRDLVPTVARDGSVPLQGFAQIGELARECASLLLAHTSAAFAVSCSGGNIVAASRRDPATDIDYVYAVNRDTESGFSGTISVPHAQGVLLAVDEYTHQAFRPVVFSADKTSPSADSAEHTADGAISAVYSADSIAVRGDSTRMTADGGVADAFDISLAPGAGRLLRLAAAATMWMTDTAAFTVDATPWTADGAS